MNNEATERKSLSTEALDQVEALVAMLHRQTAAEDELLPEAVRAVCMRLEQLVSVLRDAVSPNFMTVQDMRSQLYGRHVPGRLES